MLRRVVLVRTDVSEEPVASFIRVTRIGELGTTQAATSNRRTLRRNTKLIARADTGLEKVAEAKFIERFPPLWNLDGDSLTVNVNCPHKMLLLRSTLILSSNQERVSQILPSYIRFLKTNI
jgi:hypothetical protein